MVDGKYKSSTSWTAFNLLETTSNLQQFGNGISYLTGSTLKRSQYSYSSILKYNFQSYSVQQGGIQIVGIDENQNQLYIYSNFPTPIEWKQCNLSCLTCDQTDKCTDCYQSNNRVLKNGSCVCQKGYYQDQNNNCVKCKPNCLECSSENVCTFCDDSLNRILNNSDCGCKQDYYEELPNLYCFQKGSCPANCLNCDSQGKCDSCDSTKNLTLQNSICICATGYQLNQVTQNCESICQSPCVLCSPGTNQCLTCTKDYYFLEGICIQNCPNQYYQNTQTNTCDSCQISGCGNCQTSANICTQCKENYFFLNEVSCLLTCPNGFYQNSVENKCEQCLVKDCNTCQKQKDICESCKNGQYLLNNECLSQCPDGFYENTFEQKCEQCQVKGCKSCKKSVSICDKCENDKYLLSNECLSQCPDGFSLSVLEQKCDQCLVKGCKTCQKSINICDKCEINQYLLNNDCLFKCPRGFDVKILNEVQLCQDIKVYFDAIQHQENQININFQSNGNIDINQLNQNLNIIVPDIKFSLDKKIINSTSILATIILIKEINQIVASNVTFSNAQSLNLAYNSKQVQLELVNQLSGTEQKAAEAISATTQATSKITQAAIIPLQLSGNFRFIASLVDISQIIQIMYFLQINIPLNVQGLYEGLEEVKVPFINFFGQLQKNNKIVYSSPQKFEEKDIQGFFLDNFGDNMSYSLLIIGVHLFVKFILRNFILKKYEQSLSKISRSVLNPKYYLDLLWSIFQELCIAVFLQIQSIQKVEYFEEVINYIFFGIGFVAIFIPFAQLYMIKHEKYDWITKPLSEEVNYKSYIIFLYIRKMYIVMAITLIQGVPLAQIILITLYHALSLIVIYKTSPYKEKSDNIRHFFQTLLFLLSTLLLIFFLQNNPQEDASIGFGWFVISMFACIILIDFIFFLKDMFKSTLENLKKLKEKISSIIGFYRNRKISKLEQMQISETYVGSSEKRQKTLPEIQVNGQRASTIKVNRYNFLQNVNAKNNNSNNNNNTGAGSDEHSPISLQNQNIVKDNASINSYKIGSKDVNLEFESLNHKQDLDIDEVVSSIKIPSKDYQKSNFLSLVNSQQKLTYSNQQLNTNTMETYTPSSTQYNIQKKNTLKDISDSQQLNKTQNQQKLNSFQSR